MDVVGALVLSEKIAHWSFSGPLSLENSPCVWALPSSSEGLGEGTREPPVLVERFLAEEFHSGTETGPKGLLRAKVMVGASISCDLVSGPCSTSGVAVNT